MSDALEYMTDTKLKDILTLKVESEDLDYKLFFEKGTKKAEVDLCIDVMAMANTHGGYLVFGVRDGDYEPVGLVEGFHEDIAHFRQILANYLRPVPTIFYTERTFDIEGSKKKFAFLYTIQSKEIVVSTKDGNYQDCHGKNTIAFKQGEIFVRKSGCSERVDSDSLRLLIERISKKDSQALGKDNKVLREASELHISQLNNLQKPDFRQFIGRENYIEDILTKLNQRFFIISIDGIGGVGKTALALQVGHKCIQEKVFDAIIWVSAKNKRLSLTGIDDIVPSLTSFENLINTTLEVLGFGSSANLKLDEKIIIVCGLLRTAKCLIIVDNLETIEDNRIFDFLKELPEPSKALITSRKRLGEVERVVRLKEMSYEETKKLILMDATDKSVEQLLVAQEDLFRMIYSVTGGIPLAIRWLVGWAATGYDVKAVCQKIRMSNSPVLNFCFKEIYETLLTPEARKILSIMPIFEIAPTQEEINVALPLDEEKLEDSLAQLVTLSLINREIKPNEQGTIRTSYGILPLTLSFAQSKLSEDRGLEVSARKRLAYFLQSQKKQKEAIEQYGYALERIGATTEKGKLAALQAQLAFAAYQRGNYPESVKLFKQAVEVDPNLAYTFQLWAMIERQEGNVGKAEELYREAARLNPTNPIVWRSWSMMRKELGDLAGSAKVLDEGLKQKPNDSAMIHSSAVIESLAGHYGVADHLFEKAYIPSPESFLDRRSNMYVFAARAENFRKWGEEEEKKNELTSAKDMYTKGYAQLAEGFRFDPNDWNLIRNRIRLNRSLGRVESRLGDFDRAEQFFKRAIFFSPRNFAQKRHNSAVYYSRALNFIKMGKTAIAITMCDESIAQENNEKAEELKRILAKR